MHICTPGAARTCAHAHTFCRFSNIVCASTRTHTPALRSSNRRRNGFCLADSLPPGAGRLRELQAYHRYVVYIPPAPGRAHVRACPHHTQICMLSAGIVSEEVPSGKSSYIAASYVKYVESAGGQVVPILYPPPKQAPLCTVVLVSSVVHCVVFP